MAWIFSRWALTRPPLCLPWTPKLVPFKLNTPNRADAVEWMVEGVYLAVSVAQVAIDAVTAQGMPGVVGIGEGESFENSESRLDQVQPGSIGRRPDGPDAQSPPQGEKAGMVVGVVQVIEDHQPSLAAVAAAETSEGVAEFHQPLAATKQAAPAIRVHVVEAEELLGTLAPVVGGGISLGLLLRRPSDAADGLQFQRTPLVKAHYRSARWTAPVEGTDAFFLRSKSGSVEVF